MACGLPVIYRDSGGNRELAGEYGVPLTADLPAVLDNLREQYVDMRQKVLQDRDTFLINRAAKEYLSMFRYAINHEIEISAQYDLIFSNSALEHIADDTMLVTRLRSYLRPGGIQFHMVPSGSSLFAYLWHGYRQYTPGALARRFDPLLTDVFTLGGFASLFVHIIWITLPEKLLRRDLRNHCTNAKAACVGAVTPIDRLFGFGGLMHVVIEHGARDLYEKG